MSTNQLMFEALCDAVTREVIGRRILNLDYPFLETLSFSGASAWDTDTFQINLLGRHAFSPTTEGSPDSIVTLDDLRSWIRKSPPSWLVYRLDGQIHGYIHVEPIKRSIAESLISGHCHEGNISDSDILIDNVVSLDDYIHIGAFVAVFPNRKICPPNMILQLSCGLFSRIIDLWKQSGGPTKVLAVDFADKDGKHCFREALREYAFEKGGKTAEGDDVYILDLNRANSRIADIALSVLARKGAALSEPERFEFLREAYYSWIHAITTSAIGSALVNAAYTICR